MLGEMLDSSGLDEQVRLGKSDRRAQHAGVAAIVAPRSIGHRWAAGVRVANLDYNARDLNGAMRSDVGERHRASDAGERQHDEEDGGEGLPQC